MSIPKNHHYVPASYLNNWGDENDAKKYKEVHCWGWREDRLIYSPKKSTKSICSEEYLYSRDANSPEEEQTIESKFFSELDDQMAKVLPVLISAGVSALDNFQRSVITEFILGTRLRHPILVNQLKTIGEEVLSESLPLLKESYLKEKQDGWPETVDELLKQKDPFFFQNFSIDLLPNVITGKNNDKYHQIIHNMEWATVDVSKSNWSLLTSDKPAMFTDNLESDKCIICVPLTPSKCFIANYSGKVIEAHLKIAEKEPKTLVKMINTSIIRQAPKWVISNSIVADNFIRKHYKKP